MIALRTICGLLLLVVAFCPSRSLAASSEKGAAFAVVIGNNRSLGARRPDLHYADDDAARYFELLSTVAPGNVFLLASFDRDTRRLFPESRSRAAAPTRAELLRVGSEIADRVRSSVRAGKTPELYFVFAGHGDVDQGTGYIELLDGRFTSRDLEAWLKRIPFSRAHVILDSCNSFFMLGVRQPGGRHFATPEDAVRALASRLPNVGVFLSTSSEGEAFEWSEIQSGIFSHVVRSGLLGAADADSDGSVSYVELAGFVDTATSDVKNPNMRPHVYARGPFSEDDTPIVSLRGRPDARRFRLSDSAPLRLRVRDKEGLPLLDAHAEAGARLDLTLPEAWTDGAVVERATPSAPQAPARVALYAVPETPAVVELASLEPVAARGESRGPAQVFASLFKRPYGRSAQAAYVRGRASKPPAVYGVSQEDVGRMRLVLGEIEQSERNQRLVGGLGLLGGAAVMAAVGATFLQFDDGLAGTTPTEAHRAAGLFFGIGAAYAGMGSYILAVPRSGEEAAAEFRSVLDSGGDPALAFARADARLEDLLAAQRLARWVGGITGGLVFLGGSAWVAYGELARTPPEDRLFSRTVGGSLAYLGGVVVGTALLLEPPAARLTRIWREDPGLLEFKPAVSFSREGGMLGLVGTF